MKIVRTNTGYKIYAGMKVYKDILSITSILSEEEIIEIAEEEVYANFRVKVKEVLDRKPVRYNFAKLVSVLMDGVYSTKKGNAIGLTDKRASFNARFTRMLQNYEMAQTLGIECHLKNKLLERSNDKNEASILGL